MRAILSVSSRSDGAEPYAFGAITVPDPLFHDGERMKGDRVVGTVQCCDEHEGRGVCVGRARARTHGHTHARTLE